MTPKLQYEFADGAWQWVYVEDSSQPEPVIVSLSSSELLAAHTSPKLAVATPGASEIIVPEWVMVIVEPGETPYATHTKIVIIWGDDADAAESVGAVMAPWGNNLAATTPALDADGLAAGSGLLSAFQGQPLYVTVAGGDPTDGDGTAKVTISYKVIDIS